MSYLEELFDVQGKVAVVTGAAGGNGKGISEALLKAHSIVVLVDSQKDILEESTLDFISAGFSADMVHADITDMNQREKAVNYVFEKYCRVDVLVNNAGVTRSCPVLDYNKLDWDRTLDVNVKAPFFLSQTIGRIMKQQGSGSIINITSLNAELAFPDNPAYVASKGALKQLTKSLALDLGKYGVRVNNIGPGYFKTNMTQISWSDPIKRKARSDRTVLGRWGEPKDLAGIVLLLASDASSYITGQDIYVDGGWLIKGL